MRLIAVLFALSLLIGGVALMPSSVLGAPWISGANTYAASWVRDIEQELFKKENWPFYANDPRTPQVVALRRLNQGAKVQKAGDRALAQQLVQDALEVFAEGVRRHYYSSSEVEPITTFIRQDVPIKTS